MQLLDKFVYKLAIRHIADKFQARAQLEYKIVCFFYPSKVI